MIVKERERRRYESFKRRFEAELRQEAMEQEQQRRRSAQTIERVREDSRLDGVEPVVNAKPTEGSRQMGYTRTTSSAKPTDSVRTAPRHETQRVRHTQLPPAEHLRRRRAAEQEQPEWNDEDEE